MRLISAAAAPHIDPLPGQRTWTSIGQALEDQARALDVLEREEHNRIRLAIWMSSRVLVASGALLLVAGLAGVLDTEVRTADRGFLLRVFGNGVLLVAAGRMVGGPVLRAQARIQRAMVEWYGLLYWVAHDLNATLEQLRRADTLSQALARNGADYRARPRVRLMAEGDYLRVLAVALMALVALAAVVTFESIISPVVTVTAGCVAVAFLCSWQQPVDRQRLSGGLRVRFTHLELDPTKPKATPVELRPFTDAVAASCDRAAISSPTVWVALGAGPRDVFLARAVRFEDGDYVIVSAEVADAPIPVQRYVAGHEVAHIDLGHNDGRSSRTDARSCLALFGLLALAVGVPLWVTSTISQALPVTILLIVGLPVLLFVLNLIVATEQSREMRSREFATDRRSGDYGLSLTDEAARWLEAHDPYEQERRRWYARVRATHPSWSQRLAASGGDR